MERKEVWIFLFLFPYIKILSDILEAWIYTSNKNICFRDVKPNNVLYLEIVMGDLKKKAK